MCLPTCRSSFIIRLLWSLSLLFLLAGCAAQSVQSTASAPISCSAPPVTTPPTPTLGTNSLPTNPSQLFSSSAAADVACGGAQLHIEAGGQNCGAWIALKGHQTTYDQGAIDQIDTYLGPFVTAVFQNKQPYTPELAKQLPPLPDTIQILPGIEDTKGSPCLETLDITNTGTQTVQILTIGAKLTQKLLKNTLDYPLVDACSLPVPAPYPVSCPCNPDSGCGSGPGCLYGETLQLMGDVTKADLKAPIVVDYDLGGEPGNCPPSLMIRPQQLVEVNLVFTSVGNNYIYQGVNLSLTVQSGSGKSITLALPSSFTSTLTFIDDQQLSCYSLKNADFIQEPLPNTHAPLPHGGCI